jgi:GTP-binding protein
VNRLVGRRVCIVGEKAGITRDRKHLDFDWDGRAFTVIDTGGLTWDSDDSFGPSIREQVLAGVNEADAVIFLTDVTSGITKYDDEVAKLLRKEVKLPVYVAVNKVDSADREILIHEFYKLGFEKLYPVSALHGSHGLSEMLNEISSDLDPDMLAATGERGPQPIRVSVVGKPNVGKSSLFNKLIGEDRSIVSDISGTTRDSIDMRLTRHGQDYELVDTAGLRRKSKVQEDVERHSNIRTTHMIAACDVAVLIIDGSEEEIVSDQDQRIASLINERGKGCVVLVNKWDLVTERILKDAAEGANPEQNADSLTNAYLHKYKQQLDYKLRFVDFAPKEFISVKSGKRTDKIWELIQEVQAERKKRISTSMLNKVVSDILIYTPPPVIGQKAIKIKYASQVGTEPPEFLLFTNYPELVPEHYIRFLEGQFRQYFGFVGTPIRIRFANSSNKE